MRLAVALPYLYPGKDSLDEDDLVVLVDTVLVNPVRVESKSDQHDFHLAPSNF